MSAELNVKMLGGLSVQYNGNVIDDRSNRSKKVWLLLAYIVFSRNTQLSKEHYYDLLQTSRKEESVNPNGLVKGMIYRARNMLCEVCDDKVKEFIVYKNDTYTWNNEIPVILDTEEFERFYKEGKKEETEDAVLLKYKAAIDLYQGDFLPKLSNEPWVVSVSTYFHNMYIDVVEETLNILEKNKSWEEIIVLCKKALKIEPYSETLYQYLMSAYIALENKPAVVKAYTELSQMLFTNFAFLPSEKSREIYREASYDVSVPIVTIDKFYEQMRESDDTKGAFLCEYDFFKLLYQLQLRSLSRTKEHTCIALFTIYSNSKKTNDYRTLDMAAKKLQTFVVGSLRKGDAVARCSVSQVIVMFSKSDYDNTCKVCKRLIKSYNCKYQYSTEDISYMVKSLE